MSQPTDPIIEPAATDAPDEVEGADKLGDPGKKALDAMKAQRNAAQNELKAAQARLKEIEDRDKSETEKASERLQAAERSAAEANAKALRLEVAADKGLTPKQAARLIGATREELEADADELLASFPATPTTKPVPKPDPSQGSKPPATKRAGSFTEAITAGLAKGRTSG